MSDINGGQNTDTAKILLEMDARFSQSFLNVEKVLQNLGAWANVSMDAIVDLGDQLDRLNKSAQNFNQTAQKTSKINLVSKAKVTKDGGALSKIEMENLPSDGKGRTGKATADLVRSQKELTDAQTQLVKTIESLQTELTTIKKQNANTRQLKATTDAMEAPSRISSREAWERMMSEEGATNLRRERNRYWRNRYSSGYQKRLDDVSLELKNQRRLLNDRIIDKGLYNRFTSQEQFSQIIRNFTNRQVNSNGIGGFLGKIGATIGPTEVFSKKNTVGQAILGTGITKGGLVGAGFGFAMGVATDALTKLSQAAFSAYGTISKLETSLSVVYGSRAQASSTFNEIADYATKSPFGVQQMTDMAILLKQSGIYESDLMDTLKTIGDLAGGNEEKYRRIANNYAQVLAIGKATTKDMREFANAGIPIFAATANYLGVSRSELSNQIENGKVNAQVIEGVFKQLTGEGGLFYKATEKGAETLSAKEQNLEDTKTLAYSAAGEFFYKHFKVAGVNPKQEIMGIQEDLYKSIESHYNRKNIIESEKELKSITENVKDIDYYLRNGIPLDNKTIEELKDVKYEQTYSTDDILKIYNDAYNQRIQDVKDDAGYYYSDKTSGEIQQEIERLEKSYHLIGKLYEEVLNSGGGAQVFGLSQDLNYVYSQLDRYKQALDYKKEEELVKEELKGTERYYAHYLVEMQKQLQFSKDFFNKQATNNENSSQNINSKLLEMYKSSTAAREEQDKEEIQFLKDSLQAAELGKNLESKVANSTNAFEGMSKTEFLDIIARFYKAADIEAFKGENLKLTINDAQLLKRNLSLVSEFEWDSPFTTKDNGIQADIKALKEFTERSSYDLNNNELIGRIGEFIDKWTGVRDDVLNIIFSDLEYVGIEEDVAKTLLQEKEDEQRKRATPLWSRIIGNLFDWDSKNLEWTTYEDIDKGWVHSYAFDAYMNGKFLNEDAKIREKFNLGNRGGKFGKSGVEALLKAGGSRYLDNLVYATDSNGDLFVQNFSGSGTSEKNIIQYDWNKSFEALKDKALSLNSTTEMSSALSNFYKTEREKMSTFLTSGIITSEEWSQLTSDDYKLEYGYLGEEFEKLVNVLGDELIETENGYEIVTGAAIKAAEAFEKLLRESEVLTSQFSTLKGSIENVVNTTTQTSLKRTAVKKDLFGKQFNTTQQEELAKIAYSVVEEELQQLGINDKEARKAYLAQVESYISAAVSGNTEGFSDNTEALALIDAITEMLNVTKEGEFATLGLELEKRLKQPSNVGSLSTDAFTVFTSGSLGSIDKYGNNATEQRILNSFGKSDISYDNFKNFLSSESGADLLEAAQQKVFDETGLDAFNMGMDELLDKYSLLVESSKELDKSTARIVQGLSQSVYAFVTSGYQKTFEEIGKSLVTSENASENIAEAWKDLGKNLTSQISTLLITEGLRTMGSAATSQKWGRFGIGMAMVAAGGLGGIISGALSANEKSDNADDEIKKLQNIKDMLADLLAQARIDAEYYEKNLRHQYAISANDAISSYTKVNDAVITPKGDIISTHPDDWLIATKTPHELGGGSAPVVTITIVNESGNTVQVARTEQQRNGNNIDIKAIVVATMNEAVADGSLDSGLAMYQQRQRGKIVSY